MNSHTVYTRHTPPLTVEAARARFEDIDKLVRRENTARISARYRDERKYLRRFLADNEVLQPGTHDYYEAVHMHAFVEECFRAFRAFLGNEPCNVLPSHLLTNECARNARREALKHVKQQVCIAFGWLKHTWLEHKGPVSAYYRAHLKVEAYDTKLDQELSLLHKRRFLQMA